MLKFMETEIFRIFLITFTYKNVVLGLNLGLGAGNELKWANFSYFHTFCIFDKIRKNHEISYFYTFGAPSHQFSLRTSFLNEKWGHLG